ncbi:MAG: lasso peptide biosynthesis B2 protein [Vicinamibacteria bacterium]|nr:lasso peptide biosynthesis B2 protein [Vicinamibacteria bacterium]
MTVHTAGIAIRLWGWAALLRPLKHVMPLGTLVRLAHTRPPVRPRSLEFERRLEIYLAATGTFPRRAPANCLERSLGAYRMLCAANAVPTLVVGLRRSDALGVEGHVWVVVDGRPLAERDVTAYTQILTFDADARQHASGGSAAMLSGVRFA